MIVQTKQYEHHLPPGVQERVTKAGGRNIYGEPNFRVVWGPGERELLVGIADWVRAPKYLQERWVVEIWQPVRETPEQWVRITSETVKGQRVERMGPYPYRGNYECLAIIEDKNDNYIPVTPAMADLIVQLVHRSRELVGGRTPLERKERKLAAVDKEKQEYSNLVDDVIDDRALAFGGVPWVSQSSTSIKRRHV